jgi:gamma-glutamylaminecyclotransferase
MYAMKTHQIWVYGTLRSGNGNNRIMFNGGGKAELLGVATTRDKFHLFDGGFPRLARRPNGHSNTLNKFKGRVRGEVWKVDDKAFANCDQLEGHPTFYRREIIRVEYDANKHETMAWAYVIVRWPRTDPLVTPVDGVLEWKSWSDRHDAERRALVPDADAGEV